MGQVTHGSKWAVKESSDQPAMSQNGDHPTGGLNQTLPLAVGWFSPVANVRQNDPGGHGGVLPTTRRRGQGQAAWGRRGAGRFLSASGLQRQAPGVILRCESREGIVVPFLADGFMALFEPCQMSAANKCLQNLGCNYEGFEATDLTMEGHASQTKCRGQVSWLIISSAFLA